MNPKEYWNCREKAAVLCQSEEWENCKSVHPRVPECNELKETQGSLVKINTWWAKPEKRPSPSGSRRPDGGKEWVTKIPYHCMVHCCYGKSKKVKPGGRVEQM